MAISITTAPAKLLAVVAQQQLTQLTALLIIMLKQQFLPPIMTQFLMLKILIILAKFPSPMT